MGYYSSKRNTRVFSQSNNSEADIFNTIGDRVDHWNDRLNNSNWDDTLSDFVTAAEQQNLVNDISSILHSDMTNISNGNTSSHGIVLEDWNWG